MSALLEHRESKSRQENLETNWETPQTAYRFAVKFENDDEDGSWSVIALNLPGTGSCGPTKQIAEERFKEAAVGMIESYVESGEDIPWEDVRGDKWITVNV